MQTPSCPLAVPLDSHAQGPPGIVEHNKPSAPPPTTLAQPLKPQASPITPKPQPPDVLQAPSAGTDTALEPHCSGSASSESQSDVSARTCPQRPRFFLHSLDSDIASCDRFSYFANLIAQGAWHPEAYESMHRVVWSGMLGSAIFLFPECAGAPTTSGTASRAHLQGCHVYFEYPSGVSPEVENMYIQLCQELASHCSQAQLQHARHPSIICSTDSTVGTLASQGDCLDALSKIAAKPSIALLFCQRQSQ